MILKKISNIFIILLLFNFFSNTNASSSSNEALYTKKNISNYFSGIIFIKNNDTQEGIKYLKKTKNLKNSHSPYSQNLAYALVLDEKVQQAIYFLNNLDKDSQNFYESNLILGTSNLINGRLELSSKNFNNIIKDQKYYNFEKLIGNMLLAYQQIFEKKNNQNLFNNIPKNLSNISKTLTSCYLENSNVDSLFLNLINSSKTDYTRYIFFYINYLISKKRYEEAINFIENKVDKIENNILLDQTRNWLVNGNRQNITNIFDCKNEKHLLSELLYIIANLYSSEENYNKSNFYLNLSFYFNPKFIFNKALLAENFSNMEKYNKSKEIYKTFDKKNEIYYWHSVKKIAYLKSILEDESSAINFLNKKFENIKKPSLKNYYDMANFYKSFEKYEDSIKFYSQVLEFLKKDHPLYPLILYRRGGSYERINQWQESDKDLLESLSLDPNDPYVLNYLAYSWLERNYKLDESMSMLIKALKQKPNDPYILDSVGWAYFLNNDYESAEKYLQKAVLLMPRDPIVNDHYGDILWKLKKEIQANYFWKYVLTLESTDKTMKEKIKKKIIFGIRNLS